MRIAKWSAGVVLVLLCLFWEALCASVFLLIINLSPKTQSGVLFYSSFAMRVTVVIMLVALSIALPFFIVMAWKIWNVCDKIRRLI
jgi:ABC-type sulfate transport system permease component